jgi:hypothetical protein
MGKPFVLSLAEFRAQEFRRPNFGIDLPLKVLSVPHLHELVRVAGVTILAAELASSVGIDGPGERHTPARFAVECGAAGEGKVLHLGALADPGTFSRQTSDPH